MADGFVSQGMTKLRTGMMDAASAAGTKVVGGSDAVLCAWSGGASVEDKKRLAGSIVLMKGGGDGYFPVSPGAAIFKTTGTADATVVRAKLSRTGAESGTYYSAEELSDKIDKVWPAVCTVQTAKGGRAIGVLVGRAFVSISPTVVAGDAPFDRLTVKQEGESDAITAVSDVAVACGHPVERWDLWAGHAAVAGKVLCTDGVGSYDDMVAASASVTALSRLQGGAELCQLLAIMGQPPPYKYGDLGELSRAMTRGDLEGLRSLAVAIWVASRSAEGVLAPVDVGHSVAWAALEAAGAQAMVGLGKVAGCVTLRVAHDAQATVAGLSRLGRSPFPAIGNAVYLALQAEVDAAAAVAGGAAAPTVLGAPLVPPPPGPHRPVVPPPATAVHVGASAPGAVVVTLLDTLTPANSLTVTEVVEQLGGAERLGGLLTRALGVIHDDAFMPWTEPEVQMLIVGEWLPAVARLVQSSGMAEPTRPSDWSAAKLLLMRLAEVAARQRGVIAAEATAATAATAASMVEESLAATSARKDGLFKVLTATAAESFGATEATIWSAFAPLSVVKAERGRELPADVELATGAMLEAYPDGSGWAGIYSNQKAVGSMRDDGKIMSSLNVVHCMHVAHAKAALGKAYGLLREAQEETALASLAVRIVTLDIGPEPDPPKGVGAEAGGKVKEPNHLATRLLVKFAGGLKPTRDEDDASGMSGGTEGSTTGALASSDILRMVKAVESIIAFTHGTCGGATLNSEGNFGLVDLMERAMAKVASGKLTVKEAVQVLDIALTLIALQARGRRRAPTSVAIDLVGIVEGVQNTNFKAVMRAHAEEETTTRVAMAFMAAQGFAPSRKRGDEEATEVGGEPKKGRRAAGRERKAAAAAAAALSAASTPVSGAAATKVVAVATPAAIVATAPAVVVSVEAGAALASAGLREVAGDDLAAMTAFLATVSDGTIEERARGSTSLARCFETAQEKAGRAKRDWACWAAHMLPPCKRAAEAAGCQWCKTGAAPPEGLVVALVPKTLQGPKTLGSSVRRALTGA